MRKIPAMVDMKRTPAEKEDLAEVQMPGVNSIPDYPYGLSICLCKDELDKLEFDYEDLEPGDMVHLHCMAIVTGKSENHTTETGPTCRVELTITHISAENEEDEDEEEEVRDTPSKLYR